ncbi:MAG: InlB B-repeat-containing protein, partial [Oscillospiraceae bacterium]|nr:InlB B-repeat-containing protein [Oscillospiraceae bacterium]
MKYAWKRILSAVLIVTMLCALMPTGLAGATEVDSVAAPVVLTEEDYAGVDAVFAKIADMESAPATKSSTDTQLADAAQAIVTASENFVEGSLVRNGNSFCWMTEEGIRCRYSPRMQKIQQDMTAPAEPIADGAYNEPVATKGGWPSGNQVYLIGPFYGYDTDFTDQYQNEASAIAEAIGDTDGYTLYSGTAATIDKVATAVSNGAVVIFDSHGDTDYANGYDYVTGATSSYLCLKTSTGLTTQDYTDGAEYTGGIAYVNGTVIANHMTSNSPGGLLWMAICLGMATDTMCQPMRNKGVEVVYGYSQSVTFGGDYLYEETFWDYMCAGTTVATAVANMKSAWGNWDWSTKIANYYGYTDGYSTISAARADYSAFPVVVSDEDSHPGQRSGSSFYGADSLQTVNSTYTLFPQYNVTVQVNDSAYGSATISGNTITAVPAEGYFTQGYTVVSGSATVTQNGNTFSVLASSDCIIQINFSPKTAVTVSFSGASVSSQTGYAGDAMTLPTASAPEGFTFVGWTDSPLSADTSDKPEYYTTSYTPSGNATLYALYSYVEEGSGTGTGDYVKVTSTPADWSGEYVIVYEDSNLIMDGSLSTFDGSGNYQQVTISNGTISAEEGDPYQFIIEPYGSGYSIVGTSGSYMGCSSNANTITTGSTALENTISLDASGNANIIGSGGAYLRYNASATRFRYYKTSSYASQNPVALYLKDGSAGTTLYTSNPTVCQHSNTQTVAGTAATCTESGFTEGVYCTDCASYISGHAVIDALGHSYQTQVIAPTATEQGYTIYTCSACGDTYNADFTEALGETYTVSFVVPGGVTPIEDMSSNKSGITLPTPENPEGEYAYTFAGWATIQVDNSTEIPTLYTGSFVAAQDTTLYAVYTYNVGGSGSTAYILTDLSDIKPTDTVVITVDYQGTVYAMTSANGTSEAPTGVIIEVTTSNDVTMLASDPADDLKWNIGGTEGAYILYPAGQTSTWVYCSNANNGVRVGTGTANTFSINSDYLYNNGQSRYIGVYRTNPDWRCYTSINANITDQVLGFYVMGEPGTTYYTTVIETTCGHKYEAVVTAPTCTEAGYTTYTCSACGDSYTEAGEAALGHEAYTYAYA